DLSSVITLPPKANIAMARIYKNTDCGLGAALLEHYVCIISPVEDESLSPDVAQVMYVSVRWPWRSGLHGAAGILVPDGMASRPQNRHCSTATADAAPLRPLSGSSARPSLPSAPSPEGGTPLRSRQSRSESQRPDTRRSARSRHTYSDN